MVSVDHLAGAGRPKPLQVQGAADVTVVATDSVGCIGVHVRPVAGTFERPSSGQCFASGGFNNQSTPWADQSGCRGQCGRGGCRRDQGQVEQRVNVGFRIGSCRMNWCHPAGEAVFPYRLSGPYNGLRTGQQDVNLQPGVACQVDPRLDVRGAQYDGVSAGVWQSLDDGRC